ncbi:MAG: hypothetical protein K6T99_09105 [Armatimonadetes bacterium]|nr:hypothetical protein [Armatimonadota bacterium]
MEKRRPEKYLSGVTLRAVIIALILIPFNNYWIFLTEIVRYAGHPTTISLFYNAVFLLLVLVGLNMLLRRFVPRWVFSQGELLTIYVMINLASAMASHDMIQVLVPGMSYPFRFATPENRWASLFLDKIPKWLSVSDKEVLNGFYQGASTLYTKKTLLAWAVPVTMWLLFLMALIWVMLCLTVLLRKQWTEREKLTYPLVHLPMDLSTEKTSFFRNKLFWAGVAVAVAIDMLQGLHVLYPSIPGLRIKGINIGEYIVNPPWNAIGWTPMHFYPFGIGLGTLLPLDLSFSSWFFFLFWKMQIVAAAAFGWNQIPRFPYINEQSFGAYMGICLFAIWASRKHVASVLSSLFLKKEVDDEGEPLRYRTASIGALIGLAVLMIFVRAMGMSWWLIVAFFLIYFAMSIAITRMRAELGPPAHDLHAAGPDTILPSIIGPSKLGTPNLVVLSMMFWFNRAYRSHPMPIQLEGFKMAERASMSYRRLFGAIILATLFGAIAAFWSELHIYYQVGAGAKMGPPNVPLIFGSEPYNRLDAWLKGAPPPSGNIAWAITIGLLLTIILNSLRMRLPWFPFHPVGYAVSSSWSMNQLWMCMFIAWAIKLILLRYGGLKLYRQAVPLFLGVILGECVMGSLWTIIGIALHVQTYAFWP